MTIVHLYEFIYLFHIQLLVIFLKILFLNNVTNLQFKNFYGVNIDIILSYM